MLFQVEFLQLHLCHLQYYLVTDFKENNPLADFILRNKIGTVIESQDSQDEAFNSYSKLVEKYELFQKEFKRCIF